jgi:hypothetical protein
VIFNVISWWLWHIFIESSINFEIKMLNFFKKVIHFFNNFFSLNFFLKILTFLNAKVTKVLWYVQLFRCKTIEKEFMLDLEGIFYLCFIWEINKLHIPTPCDRCMFRCIIMFALHSTMDKAQRWITFTRIKAGLNYCFYLRPFYFHNATPSSFNNCEYYNT